MQFVRRFLSPLHTTIETRFIVMRRISTDLSLTPLTISFTMKHTLLFVVLCAFMLASCKKEQIRGLENEIVTKKDQIEQLESQVEDLQSTTGSLLDRMADLSVVNKEGAESIRQSLESLNQQYGYIESLSKKIQEKDSLNLVLVMNLKRSLTDIDDQDIQIEIREGVVHVSISDKLLFRSGSARLSVQAQQVLGKIAVVLNDKPNLNIVVEGHTDDVPIDNACMQDNWDLSVKRATAVVRTLADMHSVAPERLTASGRAEFLPNESNSTEHGRRINRRTEIIIAPRLDQFFKMLESPELVG